jgi:hypothetical protein
MTRQHRPGEGGLAGVWVAVNLADPTATVLIAAASGATAAGAINADLIAEDTRGAARTHRQDPFSPASEARIGQVLGERHHGI